MKKISFLLLILLLEFLILGFICQAAYELELEYPPVGGAGPGEGLVNYVGYIYRLALILVGLAALFSLVFGGFLYMTAETITKTDEAKKWIWGALGGLLLALTAYLILYTINPDLVKLSL